MQQQYPHVHRKKPFSHKQKKDQLRKKRANKSEEFFRSERANSFQKEEEDDDDGHEMTGSTGSHHSHETDSLLGSRELSGDYLMLTQEKTLRTRLDTIFPVMTPKEREFNRKQSMEPLERPLNETVVHHKLEVSVEMYHYDDQGRTLDLPRRPPWNYTMSKEMIEDNERKAFKSWLDGILSRYVPEKLSYFEMNIEVWRQLWRTLELSDVLLLIVDIRNPLVHFPPSLYDYVVKELGKPLILVLNKIDLVNQLTVDAWKRYFEERFPELYVVCFTRYPLEHVQTNETMPVKSVLSLNKKRYLMRSLGVHELLKACSKVKLRKKDVIVDWEALIREHEQETVSMISHDFDDNQKEHSMSINDISQDPMSSEHEESLDTTSHYITLGTIGQPNVGKSSLINGLLGRKVVSVSKTPGHTKHFQTIYLTSNVRLCDCPGLVFPSFISKTLQILTGVYSIAQVQEPYSVIQYLAELCPIEDFLKLKHPDKEDSETSSFPWSAWSISEAFAYAKHFYTAKSGRLDVYRAANFLLRMVVSGDLVISFKPKGFFKKLAQQDLSSIMNSGSS